MFILSVLTIVASVALGIWALVRALRKRPASGNQIIGAAITEGLMVLTIILTVLAQMAGRINGDPFVLWGYLITALFVLPVAVAWAFVDRSTTSSVAMFVCALTVAVMMWRVIEVAQLA